MESQSSGGGCSSDSGPSALDIVRADLTLDNADIDTNDQKGVSTTSSTSTTTPAHLEAFIASGGSVEEARTNDRQVQSEFNSSAMSGINLEAPVSGTSMNDSSDAHKNKRPRRLMKTGGNQDGGSDSESLSSDSSGLEVVDLTSDNGKANKAKEDKSHTTNNGGGKGGTTKSNCSSSSSSSSLRSWSSRTTGNVNVTCQQGNAGNVERDDEKGFVAAGLHIPPFRGTSSATTVHVDLAAEEGPEDSESSNSDSDSSKVDNDSDSHSDEDIGYIPFLKDKIRFERDRPQQREPKARKRHGSSFGKTEVQRARVAPSGRGRVTNISSPPGETSAREPESRSLVSRLWPSTSRFYIALLRWNFCPAQFTIAEDAQSAPKMKELANVPTKFSDVVEYQTTFSRLVLKETMASLQKELTEKASSRCSSPSVAGEILTTSLAEEISTSSSNSPSTAKPGKLYSLQVQVDVTPDTIIRGGEPVPPFSGGDLLGIRSPTWPSKSTAVALGVVQPWDPIYDKTSKKKHGKGKIFLRVLVCAHVTGGDGLGGPGGWIPLAHVQACSGRGSGSSSGGRVNPGVPVSLVGVGSVMTASREFQAVMSIATIPEHVRRCLLCPSDSKGAQGARQTSSSLSSSGDVPSSSSSRGLKRSSDGSVVREGRVSGQGDGEAEERKQESLDLPPPNVPAKLWKTLVESYNSSQVLAIRKVAEGSSAGFTLLQGPPGTGKTRTIMGVVGVLLGGGCPYPTWHSPSSSSSSSVNMNNTTKGSSIIIGSSLTGSTFGSGLAGDNKNKRKKGGKEQRGSGARIASPHGSSRVRVLIVAPSNAAVDELVLRLRQDGVPGANGRPFFPKVVRVGGPRGEEEGGEGGAGAGTGGDGSRRSGRDTTSPEVEAVSLNRLAEDRKKNHKGCIQLNRLDVLLEADVVCATLSGSGSQSLIECMLLCAQSQSKRKHKSVQRFSKANGNTLHLQFDAVVMDEAAQAVEPSSLIPLRFNPRMYKKAQLRSGFLICSVLIGPSGSTGELCERAVVLVGDPAQLPATIFSKQATSANYGQSLFQRLQRGGHPKLMLNTQYRMHPKIASFASSRFYHGLLQSAPTVTEQSHGQPFHGLPRFAPYLFHNVPTGRLKRGGGSMSGKSSSMSSVSLANMEEVHYITSLLGDLVRSFPATNFNGRVGVIAPYRNQIQALRRGMWNTGLRQDGVEISTVDGFQGREKDIMIFSCVRAPEEDVEPSANDGEKPNNSRGGGVGFLDDWRRLNVAITRAKYAMWIVGHAGVLKQSADWRELINDSKQRDVFVDRSKGVGVGGNSSGSSSGSGRSSGSGSNGAGANKSRDQANRRRKLDGVGARSGYSHWHTPALDLHGNYGNGSGFGGHPQFHGHQPSGAHPQFHGHQPSGAHPQFHGHQPSGTHPQFHGHQPSGAHAHYSSTNNYSAHYRNNYSSRFSGSGPPSSFGAGAGSLLHGLPVASPSTHGFPTPHPYAQPPREWATRTQANPGEDQRAVAGADMRPPVLPPGQARGGDFRYDLPVAPPKGPTN